MLYIELLGQVRITFGPDRERLHLCRQSTAILGNLALSGVRRQAREVLIERFWPDCDPARGQGSLSSALWRLRRDLAPAGASVLTDGLLGEAGITEQASFWLDAEAFRAKVRPACTGAGLLGPATAMKLEQALELYRGDLLEGFYYDWVLAERECLRALYVRGRLRLLDHHAAGSDWERAIECGREVLRLDPLRETVHRRLIELHARNGEPAAARRQYHRLVQLLAEELQVAPAPETVAVWQAFCQPAGPPSYRPVSLRPRMMGRS
jgi:DNA-binding SARP family transcriptional activator